MELTQGTWAAQPIRCKVGVALLAWTEILCWLPAWGAFEANKMVFHK